MPAYELHPISGEFRRASTEAAFRTERLPETWRQARLAFVFTVVLNTLFLVSDWRFYGDPHFFVAVPARPLRDRRRAARLGAAGPGPRSRAPAGAYSSRFRRWLRWGVGLLVTARTDLALLVVGLLPVLFYSRGAPTSFRAAVVRRRRRLDRDADGLSRARRGAGGRAHDGAGSRARDGAAQRRHAPRDLALEPHAAAGNGLRRSASA